MSTIEEALKKTIMVSQEANKDIIEFKEQVKEVEQQTKAKQENLINVLTSALEANNQRPLKTKDNAYVYLKQTKSDLTVIPNRLAEICDGITTEKLLQVNQDITTDTNNLPSLLDVVFVAVKQQVEDVCCATTESVSVSRRRPARFGNVEAKDATPQVEKHVEEYLRLNDNLGVVRGQKKKGVDAFKAEEKHTSDVLMRLVGSAMKDGNVPSANMRFVPAPPSQKNIQVVSADTLPDSEDLFVVEGLPKVPASLEEFVGKKHARVDNDDTESIVLVPGLENAVTIQLKLPDDTEPTAAKAKPKKETKLISPKSSEFIASLTKEAVYGCIKPALIASGAKEDSIHTLIKKPVTQELLHKIWTQASREQFTMAMLALRETIGKESAAKRAKD